MDSGPVATFQVHEYLRPKVRLCLLFLDKKPEHVFYYFFNVTSSDRTVFSCNQLCDLYENDSIFDKFECCLSGDGLRVATGSYRSAFFEAQHIFLYHFSIKLFAHCKMGEVGKYPGLI